LLAEELRSVLYKCTETVLSRVQIHNLLAENSGVPLVGEQGHDGLNLGAREDVAEVGELLGPVPGLQIQAMRASDCCC